MSLQLACKHSPIVPPSGKASQTHGANKEETGRTGITEGAFLINSNSSACFAFHNLFSEKLYQQPIKGV